MVEKLGGGLPALAHGRCNWLPGLTFGRDGATWRYEKYLMLDLEYHPK